MTRLSPSELVYLHAEQFIFPRHSPYSNTTTVYSSKRQVNLRLMVIEVTRAAILANLTFETIRLEFIASKDLQNTINQLGQVGGMVGNLLKAVGVDAQKPKAHLIRLEKPNPWQPTMLESVLLGKLEATPMLVEDLIPHLFGTQTPDNELVDLMRKALLERGILEQKKGFLGTNWKLSQAGQAAIAIADLETVKKMYSSFQETADRLEHGITFGFSRSDD